MAGRSKTSTENWKQLGKYFGQCIDEFAESAEILAKSDLIENKTERVNSVFKTLQTLDRLQRECQARENITAGLAMRVTTEDVEDFEPMYTEAVAARRQALDAAEQNGSAQRNASLLRTENRLRHLLKPHDNDAADDDDDDDGEEDIQLTQNETLSTKCPITQKTFVEPVRSVHCGHTYERAAVYELMKRRPFTCPVLGCQHARQVLRQGDLRPDKQMMHAVQSQQQHDA